MVDFVVKSVCDFYELFQFNTVVRPKQVTCTCIALCYSQYYINFKVYLNRPYVKLHKFIQVICTLNVYNL